MNNIRIHIILLSILLFLIGFSFAFYFANKKRLVKNQKILQKNHYILFKNNDRNIDNKKNRFEI
jgi:hypothetical protein